MSQFDEIVKNIALENKKCKYNPKKSTNWNKLSWNMKKKCMKHMDFKTRNRLRQTSDTEKYICGTTSKALFIARMVAFQTEQSNYNPKIDMNWCMLPMEMRNECVKRMDFKTRCRLRGASKHEQSLVHSKKYRFKQLLLEFDHVHSRWDTVAKINTWHGFYRNDKNPNFELISAILKHAEVEHFDFMAEDDLGDVVPPVLKQLEKLAPFPFKRVSMDRNLLFIYLLKHCPNLEKVDFTGCKKFPQFLLDMILDVPTVMNIKELCIPHPFGPGFPKFMKKLVQKWIDNDAEVGKSIQFDSRTEGILYMFFGEFTDRIIEQTDEKVRIRMDNGTKQILVRHIGSRVPFMRPREINVEYCSCKVIPIDMPESEYPTGDEWIQTVYEKALEMDRYVIEEIMWDF